MLPLGGHFLRNIQVIDFALVVLRLLMFKVCVITAISKIVFFSSIFPVLKGLRAPIL